MSLLKRLIKEMAAGGAVSADAVAGVRGSLFGGGLVDPKKAKKRQLKMLRRLGMIPVKESLGLNTDETAFDASDVISKLDAAEKKAKANKDTVAFGLEDEDGNIVKVYVKADQADDFEKVLSSMLSGDDDENSSDSSSEEIAEILYKLKDRFDIVDAEWPTIEGDEEEEQEVQSSDQLDNEVQGGDDLEKDQADDVESSESSSTDDEAAKTILQQVIDAMKAEAEAKEAEARAKEAEAKAKEAEYVAKAAAAKVQQEEEILDMEAYYKEKKEKEQEAKMLAQLAKYKHDKAKEAEIELAAEEEEVDINNDEISSPWDEIPDTDDGNDTITVDQLASLILHHLRSQ